MPSQPRRAAQYLRMSTERQNYSTEYQSAHNEAYAREHGYELVKTYADAGVSGLRLRGRDGLKALLADVLGGAAGFTVVLVYDVSRWGRFQDLDQGAHYEFICREAGVQIVYTGEPFRDDLSLSATIVKHVKRAMAAEFSRDLSAKVARAQRGLAYKGFWVNGPPGYGLRRVAATIDKGAKFQMEHGEYKGLRGDRTILVHGPEQEVQTVRRIYSLFLTGGMKPAAVAHLLNEEGVLGDGGRTWTAHRVRQVLTNEKYAGAFQRNKSKGALGMRHSRPRSEWVRVPGAVEPIVSKAMFEAVQAQFRRPKSRNPTDAELLVELQLVLRDHGRISRGLIDAHPDTHCAAMIGKRFGGLLNAMRLIEAQPSRRQLAAAAKARLHRPWGFRPTPRPIEPEAALAALQRHFARLGWVSSNTIDNDPDLPSSEWYRRQFGNMARLYELLGYEPTAKQRRHMKSDAVTSPAPEHVRSVPEIS